jgi:hypothetical protein
MRIYADRVFILGISYITEKMGILKDTNRVGAMLRKREYGLSMESVYKETMHRPR